MNFDMSFGIMGKSHPSEVISDLSEYLTPQQPESNLGNSLRDVTPTKYIMDWSGDGISSRSAQYMLNSWRDFTRILLNANANDKAEASIRHQRKFVVNWVADWIMKFPYDAKSPTKEIAGNQFAWYDMAVGSRAGILGHLLSLKRRGVMKARTRELLKQSAKDHLTFLRDPSHWASHSNHGMYQSMGLFALVRQAPETSDELEADRSLAINRIQSYLSIALSEDGVLLEHSPFYHSLVLRALKSIIVLLDQSRAEEKALIDTFSRLQPAQAAMFMPNGVLAPFGDSHLMEASRLRPEDDSVLEQYSPKLQFLVTNGQKGERSTNDLYYSRGGGFASFKSDEGGGRNSFLAASGWFHSLVHKQMDDLSLIWAENDMLILADPGGYPYEGQTSDASDLRAQGFYYDHPNRIYVESAHAHNTVEIDNRTDSRREAPPYKSAFAAAEKISGGAVVFDMDIIREPRVHHKRLCIYVPGELLAVIDELESIDETPHDFTQWWQFFPSWELQKGDDETQLSLAYNGDWERDSVDSEASASPDFDVPNVDKEQNEGCWALFSDPEISINGAFGCALPDGTALPFLVTEHKQEGVGEKLKGWTSLSPGKMEPASSVGVSVKKQTRKAVISAVFEIHRDKHSGDSVKNVDVELGPRQMKAVSWESDSDIQKVRYRRKEGSLEVYIGNRPKITISRSLHPRNEEAQALMKARTTITRGGSVEEVRTYFDVACRSSWPVAIKEAAEYARDLGDQSRQLDLLEKAYKVGGSGEILPFARALIVADSSRRDFSRAEALLKEAVRNNVRAAYYHLGELYGNPDFDGADQDKAKNAYLSGAQKDHSGSIVRLAEIAENSEDYFEALLWYEKAALNHNKKAQYKLAQLYSNKQKLPEKFDFKLALRYFVLAAERGSKLAAYHGAILALDENKNVHDPNLGRRLLSVASEAGSGLAAYKLAVLLLEDKDVDQERVKALLNRAKDMGVEKAHTQLKAII